MVYEAKIDNEKEKEVNWHSVTGREERDLRNTERMNRIDGFVV